MNLSLKNKNDALFYGALFVSMLYFFWTRLDPRDHIYFWGDGDGIVALIQLMLESGDWTADNTRIASSLDVQKELLAFNPTGFNPSTITADTHSFNLSGYTRVGALFCSVAQTLGAIFGFKLLSVAVLLHVFNVLLQSGILLLLFLIGKKMSGRCFGLLSMVFFICFPLAVSEARYERPECWLSFLTALILYLSFFYTKHPIKVMAAIGLTIGFSLAVKISQLFLGVIPLAFLVYSFFQAGSQTKTQQLRRFISHGMALMLGIFIALIINIPYVFNHFDAYWSEMLQVKAFYDSPRFPYALESYSYLGQIKMIAQYFWLTLGFGWCVILLLGISACLLRKNIPSIGLSVPFTVSLIAPVLFLFFYFSSKINFIERLFSSVEPMICLLSAIGAYALLSLSKKIMAAGFIGILFILWPAVNLNTVFAYKFIWNDGYQERIKFQQSLKNDFPKFWIKNIYFTFNAENRLPEKPLQAPRIYHIEDYNEHWTRSYLSKLEASGFVYIGRYCSPFYSLPPSNHTILHAPAKNHYFIHDEDLPKPIIQHYFKTNCPKQKK